MKPTTPILRIPSLSTNAAGQRSDPAATGLKMCCRAFTLIELLVVIAIIAVLAALSVGALKKATDSAKETKCAAKLRAIGSAFTLYQADSGKYPKAAEYTTGFTGRTFWFFDIYPYLSDGHPFELVDDKKETPLRCPSAKKRGWPYIDYGLNCYALPLGVNDIPAPKINDPSRTFLVADTYNWCIAGWYGSLAEEVEFRHGNTANFLMFDGHVEKITAKQLEDQDLVKRLKGSY
jgi:prepilin-type N-terminal cleavage/methylation domain-containing protein/prepilin-type processing-associated H-X9-DG protein